MENQMQGLLSFTLRELSEVIKGGITEEYLPFADETIDIFDFNTAHKNTINQVANEGKHAVVFDIWMAPGSLARQAQYAELGVWVVSSRKTLDNSKALKPAIIVDNANEALIKLGQYIIDDFDLPLIAVTGAVGKTTTTMLLESVFKERHKVFVSGGNRNIPISFVKQMIMRYKDGYDFHIQECGAGRSKLVEDSARVLRPKGFGITKISLTHHLSGYVDSQDLINDKVSFDRFAKSDAYGVINFDDEILSTYDFKHRIISYAVENENADYVARNIVQNGDYLEFDIDNHETTVPVRVQIIGKHNAYNILMTYIFAKEEGFSDEEIQKGLSNYKSEGIRQSVEQVAGRKVYIDCFNVCADSIISSMTALNEMDLEDGAKKLAVLAGENALGERTYEINYDTGKKLDVFTDVDELIFVGPEEPATLQEVNHKGNGRSLYEGARAVIHDRPLTFTTSLFELAEMLREKTQPGDAILLKGIFRQPLFAALDIAFGTSYLVRNANFGPERMIFEAGTIDYYPELGGANFRKSTEEGKRKHIPGRIGEYDIIRYQRESVSSDSISVVINPPIRTIGRWGFRGFKKLRYIEMPDTVRMIENGAFSGCSSLESAILAKTETIQARAFRACVNLAYVELGNECVQIADDAFMECSNKLTICAPEGSYAQEFAEKHEIRFMSKNSLIEA